jgi:hypothetical protein
MNKYILVTRDKNSIGIFSSSTRTSGNTPEYSYMVL